MDFPGIEFITEILGEAARADLSQKVFLFSLAWFIVRKTINQHLSKIESSLSSLAQSVGQLKESIVRLELNHDNRIVKIEKQIETFRIPRGE